jgi:hypothetical protein
MRVLLTKRRARPSFGAVWQGAVARQTNDYGIARYQGISFELRIHTESKQSCEFVSRVGKNLRLD